MPAPHHIIGAPLDLYLGPVGTTLPAIDDAEGAFDPAWIKVGDQGSKDYSEEGVTVSSPQALNYVRGAGSTVPRKAFRNEEDLTIGVSLLDLSPEEWAQAINDATVTTVAAGAGTAGEKSFSLYRGVAVAHFALLARGPSTVDNDLNLQLEVGSVIEDGSPAPVFTKGNPAMLALSFRAIDAVGDGASFATVRVQTAVPTS